MNIQRLREAEATFLLRFPQGFDDPGLEKIRKSHNVDQVVKFAQSSLTPLVLSQPNKLPETLITIIGRSSMVSRFEKPLFKEFMRSLGSNDKQRLADSYRKRLVGGKKREGFEEIVDLFARFKLARWSLVSAVPFYFAPTKEVFVKPTTAKKIITLLEVGDLHYRARPDWTFYAGFRKLIAEITREVDPSLTPNNAATTGFLMATL